MSSSRPRHAVVVGEGKMNLQYGHFDDMYDSDSVACFIPEGVLESVWIKCSRCSVAPKKCLDMAHFENTTEQLVIG